MIDEEIPQAANLAVIRLIHRINTDNAGFGITQTEPEHFAQSKFRRGLCGKSCDAVLKTLNKQGVTDYQKVNFAHKGETHFFLQTSDGEHIIEPTWKQIAVFHAEEQRQPVQFANALSHYPDVFVGTREAFEEHITSACRAIGAPARKEALKGYWGL